MANAVQSTPRLFADDTCLIISNNSLSIPLDNFNTQVKIVCDWCTTNTLTINPSKSNALVISPIIFKHISDFNLLVNNLHISLKNNVNYLRVQPDSKLNFLPHLNIVEHQLSTAVRILYKLKKVFTRDALLKLYYALIQPHLLYGLIL